MDEPPPINLKRVATEVGVAASQVESVVALLDEGNTVPFITRYRKEQTGNLDEEQIRAIQKRVKSLRQVAIRAQAILRLIESQGKLTDELRRQIEQADSLKRLEDLYLPYRPKRQSRAMLARQRGLEPLAERIWNADAALGELDEAARAFVSDEKELPTTEAVLQGAADILIERISDESDVREIVRRLVWRTGRLVVSAGKAAPEKIREFENYVDYSEPLDRIPPHRILAVNRGERLEALRVKVAWDDARALEAIERHFGFQRHRYAQFLRRCAAEALQRSIGPVLEREVRRELTERAEEHAIAVFARNLRHLLLQPPLSGQRVLAVDPGFRTGCKIAVLDECGHLLATDVIYATGSDEKKLASAQKLAALLKAHGCNLIAIGNGTACRETEEVVTLTIENYCPEARYVIVNEAGASIYSTSTVAREELPDFDATVRGTISIGRRLQDPLSELVKIEPQHIGVGMYQHDINPKRLRESLNEVVESCVNYVGVDLNTASASLLRYVSGLNQLIARRIVEWRKEHGRFTRRQQLLEVAGIGEATFTQAAGFLKITDGEEPLDSTWIHPESYDVAYKLLERLELSPDQWRHGNSHLERLRDRLKNLDKTELAAELRVGLPTLCDILDDLLRPGRDPRQDLPGPVFKRGILTLDDLREGMELTGTVLNVVDFGAFVDVGLKDSGLVHVSEISTEYVRSPHDVLTVGNVITVWVLSIDRERRRVALTMIPPGTPRPERRGPSPRESRQPKSGGNGQTSVPPAESGHGSEGSPPRGLRRQRTRGPASSRRSKRPSRGGSRAPVASERQSRKQTEPPAPLSAEAIAGKQPLRSFSELKQLWEQRAE
ncbi:MAG: RNA-binding transcriptional accessory protein [Planctomycetes bacterium]|nr:RNA-binding transcriptional accessory protein [Planctomycetota bacterium]